MTRTNPSATERQRLHHRLVSHSAVRYLVAGGLAFLVDFGLLAAFKELFRWPTWLAAGAAFLLSFAFTYFLQRTFSFASTTPHGPAVVKYAALVGVNTIATAGIVAVIAVTPLGWAGGKVIATAITTLWNYFVYRHWIFAKPARGEEIRSCSTER